MKMKLGMLKCAALSARLIAAWCCLTAMPARAQTIDDDYLRGYAASILERQFHIWVPSLLVEEGTVYLRARDLGAVPWSDVRTALAQIQGVRQVMVITEEGGADEVPIPMRIDEPRPETASAGEFLPAGHLFRPLMADQRWPHFSSIAQNYQGDDELENVGAVSLGATIPVYENDFLGGVGRWSVGLEGVVFSVFDLDAKSKDLVNSDYWVGIPFSYSGNGFSAVARVFHQSSHLGDEYLLRNPVTRIDLNYEAVDFRLSYDFLDKIVRIYGGGGYIFSKNPKSLKSWSTQGGFEFQCPRTFFKHLRPVAGLDLQMREENDYEMDWSARIGVQLDAERLQGRTLQILFEYYHGHSPNGQFFERDIEYYGIGIHFYL